MPSQKILLVQPEYYTTFPPVGLLKISTYHKRRGDSVQLVRGYKQLDYEPDLIYVTSLFTWAWKPVWEAVQKYKLVYPRTKIILGGVYASIMPEHAKKSGADIVHVGLCDKFEDMPLDYSLVPDWDGSIIHSSRGCGRKCGFCAVPRIEGKICRNKESIRDYVIDSHSRIFFFDNNFLMNPHRTNILKEAAEYGKLVDFNQALDARLMNEELANLLSELKMVDTFRMSYDSVKDGEAVKRAIKIAYDANVAKSRCMIFMLYNYTDTPQDFFDRLKNIMNWHAVCYPMKYEPLNALAKNQYISPNWTKKELKQVQRLRNFALGKGTTFAPSDRIVELFNRAHNLNELYDMCQHYIYDDQQKLNLD